MITHFTADLHLEHEGIIKMACRPFRDIDAHNRYMISQINKYVSQNHRLIIAGDLAWRGWNDWRPRINCKNVHIVWGNHDRPNFAKTATTAADHALVKISLDVDVFVSHYPNAYWPKSHYGSYHVYGHVHADREATLDVAFPGRRSIDVGLDNARRLLGKYRPFSEFDLHSILGRRPGHDDLNFYRQLQEERWTTFNGEYIEA